jgi:hypothetical protein
MPFDGKIHMLTEGVVGDAAVMVVDGGSEGVLEGRGATVGTNMTAEKLGIYCQLCLIKRAAVHYALQKYNERSHQPNLLDLSKQPVRRALEFTFDYNNIILTSGPFGDSMSAAARPKRWGVFRQAKGREFDPSSFEHFTLLT